MFKKNTYSDAELLEMLSSGKRDLQELAFADLYSKYSSRIFAYCQRVFEHGEEANDLFQETFIKFYNAAIEGKIKENIFPYLIVIVRNLSLNHQRNKKHFVELVEYDFPSDNKTYEEQELAEILSHALNLLEFDYREVFVLRQYQGLDYNQIAELTNTTVANAKTKYWRAKEKLKEILSPYLFDDKKKVNKIN